MLGPSAPQRSMTAGMNILHWDTRIAAAVLTLVAGTARAQAPQSLDLQLPQPRDERAQVSAATSDETAIPDENVADTATSVHGSFTTGIGIRRHSATAP